MLQHFTSLTQLRIVIMIMKNDYKMEHFFLLLTIDELPSEKDCQVLFLFSEMKSYS